MPEGPSLIMFREELLQFKGRKILHVSGSAKIDQQRMVNKKLKDLRTWGKHLLFCFDDFTVRVHFLMFGTYYINSEKAGIPKLSIEFNKGYLNLYSTAIKMFDEPVDEVYDWSNDVMSDEWDPKAARKKLKAMPDTLVADALLDQEVFSGVGNIIKNEVLYRIRLHPKTPVGEVPPRKLTEMITEARNYTFDFLKWKREGTLRAHWLAYTKNVCSRDGDHLHKEYVGETKRRTFFCNTCQKFYGR